MKRREEMSFIERLYIPAILQGLVVTFGRLFRNLGVHILHACGLARPVPASVVISYPESRRPYAPHFRGRHRLTLKDNGSVKCTSCFLCATACPARCIYIEPAEHSDPLVEKYPGRFEIDTLLCIYCGYCVEACPVDAIRMDTGIHPLVYQPDPRLFIEDKEVLMARSRQMQQQSPEDIYLEHQQGMLDIEKHPFKKAVAIALLVTACAMPLRAEQSVSLEVPALPSGVPSLPDPDSTPRLISSTNAADFQKLILPELYTLVKSGELELEAVRELRYSWRFDDEWERNSRSPALTLPEDPTAPQPVTNFRRGFAFGADDIINQETDRSAQGRKILWNINSLWWSQKLLSFDFDLFRPVEGKADFFLSGTFTRLSPRALDEADKTAQIFRERLKFAAPPFISRLALLSFRFEGPDEDALWLHSAATGKTRELTGSNRTDALARTPLSMDDLLVWSGKPELTDVTVDRDLVALIPFPALDAGSFSGAQESCEGWQPTSRGAAGQNSARWNYLSRKHPRAAAWQPTNAYFVPRSLYRLELVSRNPFSLYGRQVLYVDMKSMLPVAKVVYDRAGRHWKTIFAAYGLASLTDKTRRIPVPAFMIIKDNLNSQTWVLDYTRATRCENYSAAFKLADFSPAALGPAQEQSTRPAAKPAPASSTATPVEDIDE
jgi:NADH-quinone oxidoreductase subunit I